MTDSAIGACHYGVNRINILNKKFYGLSAKVLLL
jgi:hypothetical protein